MNTFYISAFCGQGFAYKGAQLANASLAQVLARQRQLPVDTPKGHDWKIYPWASADGEYHGGDASAYTGTGILLMDIDSKEVYAYLCEHHAEFFSAMPSAICVWPSHSRKAHIAFRVDALRGATGDALASGLTRAYQMLMCDFIDWYSQSANINLYGYEENATLVCDTHNARVHQAIALNPITEYFVNPAVETYTEPDGAYDANRARFPDLFAMRGAKSTKSSASHATTKSTQPTHAFGTSPHAETGKFLVDRHFTIGGFAGNEARWRIMSSVLRMFGGDLTKAEAFIREHFINDDEILSNGNHEYTTSPMVDAWVQRVALRYTADETYELQDGEYVSDLYADIMGHISKARNIHLVADCGTGKSEFMRRVLLREKKVVIVCHLKAIKEGVYERYEDVAPYITEGSHIGDIMRRGESLPSKMVVTWEVMARIISNDNYRAALGEYISLWDESHNLVTALCYRYEVIYKLTAYSFVRTIFCTATPAGEDGLLGNDVVRMRVRSCKKATVGFSLVNMVDSSGAMRVSSAEAHYVPTLVSLIKDRYEDYDSICILDNRNHAELSQCFPSFSTDFCRDRRDETLNRQATDDNVIARKVFITTTYGTQGIELKGREEIDGYDPETLFFTTATNDIRKVCCIFPVWGVTRTDVIQTINRFRRATEVDVIFLRTDAEEIPCEKNMGYIDSAPMAMSMRNALRGEAESSALTVVSGEEASEPAEMLIRRYLRHRRSDSLTTITLPAFFPIGDDVCVDYVEPSRARKEALGKYQQFRSENVAMYIYNNSTASVTEALENFGEYEWAHCACVQKQLRRDMRLLDEIYTLCLCGRTAGTDEFERGRESLMWKFTFGQERWHFQSLRDLLRARASNPECEKVVAKLGALGLPDEPRRDNYEWVCYYVGKEVVTSASADMDDRGRVSTRRHKFALASDPSRRYYTKQEAFCDLKPQCSESHFCRRGWQEYIVRISA